MRYKTLVGWLFLLMLISMSLPAAVEDSLSCMRKVNLFHTLNQSEKMIAQLQRLDTSGDTLARKHFIANLLEGYGDEYRRRKENTLAEMFYRQVVEVDPQKWKVFNKLNGLYRDDHGIPLHLPATFKQFSRMLRNFTPSFLLLNRILHSLTVAVFWVFMMLALVMLMRYFPLAQTDLFRDDEWRIKWIHLVMTLLLLLWPLAVGIGWWMVPFLILGFLWVYIERPERRSIMLGMAGFLVVILLAGFQQVLDRSYQSKAFSTTMKVFHGQPLEKDELKDLDSQLVVLRAFSQYEAGNMETALDLLESTGEAYRGKLKYQLLAGIQYRFGNITECIANLRLALRVDDKDPVSLNNFTLALLENGNHKLLDSYIQRYPQIRKLKGQYLQLLEPKRNHFLLWRRLFSRGRDSFAVSGFIRSWAHEVLRFPGALALVIFFGYLLLIPKLLGGIGKSISCSKCDKHIDRASIHRSYKLCGECYQLFMIKDVMFLEAKVLKEKELMRKQRFRKAWILLISLFSPGLNLLVRSRHALYFLLATPMFFLMAFFWTARHVFRENLSVIPLFFQLIGALAVLSYVLINLVALKGEEDGI